MTPHDPDASHVHPPEAPPSEVSHDAAAASLTGALRLSFRVLSFIMLVVLVLFAFSGVTTIESGERGIVTVFGRKVAVVGPGLHYTWPYPIGRIEKVLVRQQVLDIHQFWMGESPEDKTKPLASRMPSGKGLRPGWDGALLTGDAFLFHVKLQAVYEVEDPAAFLSGLEDPTVGIEAAVCRAAILVAANRTVADMVDSEDKSAIALEIRQGARDALKQMNTGVNLTAIRFLEPTRPLHVLPAQQMAQNASQEERTAQVQAIQEAGNFLRSAVGPEYGKLVGEPWLERNSLLPSLSAEAKDPNDHDLIGQYEAARSDPNLSKAQCEPILARIDEVLLSLSAQGEVTAILGAANRYWDARKSAVRARAETLEKLLAEYNKAPDFFLQSLWTDARKEILQSPSLIKWFLNPGQTKTILQVNIPPEILREIQNWYLKGSSPSAPPGAPSGPPPEDRGGP